MKMINYVRPCSPPPEFSILSTVVVPLTTFDDSDSGEEDFRSDKGGNWSFSYRIRNLEFSTSLKCRLTIVQHKDCVRSKYDATKEYDTMRTEL